ncbi:MAG: aromatic amino acid transport family protein [Patescibacteria group bacterium]|mgnify:CR=1 FL=1
MNKTLLAVATLIGTTIGAGTFAIPYVFSQSGVITCLVYFLIVGVLAILLHLFFGEIVLRTKDETRLIGLSKKYLGQKARIILGIALIIGTVGSLLVYVILAGQFLALIFPNLLSPISFSLLAWLFLSFLVFLGTHSIAKAEVLMSAFLFLIGGLVIIFCLPKIQASNFILLDSKTLFLPFGIFLFSMVGWSAVPESEDVLTNKKNLKKAIIIALLICLAFYILFGIAISGVTGKFTTQEGFLGLVPYLGKNIMIVAGIFGLLAVSTSFIAIANYLKNTFVFDLKIPKQISFLLAVGTPLVLFLMGLRSFVSLVSALGAFIGAVEGTAIVMIWRNAKKIGDRAPEYKISLPNYFGYLIIILLVLGVSFQFFVK